MFVIRAEGIAMEWDGKQLFENVNLEINEGEHIALIGNNGTGKTTLFNILSTKQSASRGYVYRKYPVNEWGIVEQQLRFERDYSLLEYVQSGDRKLSNLKRKTSLLEKSDQSNKEYLKAYQDYIDLDGYSWELEVEKLLKYFKLEESLWNLSLINLSGGQKTLAQLTKSLINNPKIILLDEPTNHIDQESLSILEKWIKEFKGTVLFISHDRYFLDQTADVIYELTPNGTTRYQGGYTKYLEQKELEKKTKIAAYQKQEKEKRHLQETIERFKQWYNKADNAASVRNSFAKKKATKHVTRLKAKEKALERLEKNRIEKPKDQTLNFELKGINFESRTLVKMEKISFSYDDNPLIKDFSLSVNRGDHIATLGKNGIGKSTLLKLITGELQVIKGEVYHHPQLKIGYFAQELNNMDLDKSIIDTVLENTEISTSDARNILASFMFKKDDVFKTINDLSIGERCRVAFVNLYFSDANLLILDEPTNFLDIATRERIEEVLSEYPGAFIIVSHDKYFIRKVANKIVDMEEDNPLFYGNLTEYEEYRKARYSGISDKNQNRLAQLKLELVSLMSTEIVDDQEEKTSLMNRIIELKKEIESIEYGSVANETSP